MKLENCTSEIQLNHMETLYLTAFPKEERKPFPLLIQKSQENTVELLAIEDENRQFLGLAVTVLYKDLVLLDYFAIMPEMRGQNVGSRALHLLKERYHNKKFILEIEDAEDESSNQQERIRRKAFYLKNNMILMPYPVELFGVKMQILTSGDFVSFEAYHEIYEKIFPGTIAQNIKRI